MSELEFGEVFESRSAHDPFTSSSSDGTFQNCRLFFVIITVIQPHYYSTVAADTSRAASAVSRHIDTARKIGDGMKYLVSVVLVLLGIKYQSSPNLLFVDNDIQHWFLVVTLCIYCVTIHMLDRWSHLNQRLIDMLNYIVGACKVLSAVSLVSLLFPSNVSILVIPSTALIILLNVIVKCILIRREIAEFLTRFSRATVGRSLPV